MARKKPSKPNPDQLVPKALARALAGQKPGVDSAGLLSDLIDVWGGTRQLAIDMHAEFQRATKGGMTRQRILEMVQRLIVTNTTQELNKPITPSDMSQEDLEQVALAYLRRISDDGKGTAAEPRAE